MNGVGDRCKAVLLLVGGDAPLADKAAVETRGFHCACSVLLPRSDLPVGDCTVNLQSQVRDFCSVNALPVTFLDDNAVEKVLASPSSAMGMLQTPLTVATCAVGDVAALRSALLSSQVSSSNVDDGKSPYCLLAVLDMTHRRCPETALQPHGQGEGSPAALAWLRPTQSYVSEYTQEGGHTTAELAARLVLFPLHMYSAMPMVRDVGHSPALGDVLSGDQVCTLEGALRELGYKAGQLPKYGA